MYIKEISIDGFKSYAQQTIISPFDAHFNAITGLNGSGKSNILDSICFVLGISNLSQVRATHLQELIYKGGNAGITKATVSITFDNMDKNQSPPGYQDYEEITITRQISVGNKHKYLINGQNATAQRVTDLFCSVQLNVNNPNFLIMQGKITKVLNMKPIEVLSMIEEAAGTKTYDIKKANALKTIEHKNSKLNEIERVLKEDITPAIEKLKQERSAYIEYQKCEREYLHLHKVSIAFKFYQADQAVQKSKSVNEEVEKEYENLTENVREIEEKIAVLKKEINNSMAKIEKTHNDDQMIKFESDLKQNRMELAKLTSELNNIKNNLKTDTKRHDEIKTSIKDNEKSIEAKETKLNEMKSNVETLETDLALAEQNLKKAQKEYEALCCGFVIDEDTSQLQTIQDQILNIRNKISDTQTSVKKAQLKLENAQIESEKLKKELKADTQNYEDVKKNFESRKQEHDKFKIELDSLNYDSTKWEQLSSRRNQINNEIYNLNEKIQILCAKYPQLNFEYKDPEPNFDRSKVKGLVCSLFKIKDARFSTAIETAAGGRLFNLVVDTDKTGKLILQKGELKRKVTIAPMNQIRGHPPSDRVVRTAKDLVGSDKVHTALSLIEYDPVYQTVMEYVFGTKLICFDLDSAKSVAFHPQVMTTTITIDGDQFDPEGTLSGGARGERANFLARIKELGQAKEELAAREQDIIKINADLKKEKEISIQYTRLKNDYDLKANQLNLAKLNLEQTTHHQKLEKLNNLNEEIKTQEEEKEKSKIELENLKVKLVDLEQRVKNGNDIEKDKQDAQKKINEAKANLESKQISSSQLQQDYKSINMDIDVLKKEIQSYAEELEKLEENLKIINEQINSKTEQIEEFKEEEDIIIGKLNQRKEVIKEKNREIDSMNKECDRLEKEKNSAELKLKELAHKKSDFKDHLETYVHTLDVLMRENSWIEEEKKLFGQANSIYDFTKQNIKEVNHRLHELKNRKEKLSKQVDMRAMGMLAKKEEEYEELTKKRQIVLRDRATLETTIEDLEKIKTEVLIKAFDSINKDLGNIFKTLLPGAFAKLEWVNRHSLLDGVEFKVAFGDVWKESLTELSGGQRSLVALSLILSLLLYNPAPLYILDEVDAALDTSHTQNIGLMIKKYFKKSQFVIVSLKDGMFNNANVLFRTKLIDGVSTIQRYEQKKKGTTERERDYTAFNDQTNQRR